MRMERDSLSCNVFFSLPLLAGEDRLSKDRWSSHCPLHGFGTGQHDHPAPHLVNLVFNQKRRSQLWLSLCFPTKLICVGQKRQGLIFVFKIILKLGLSQESWPLKWQCQGTGLLVEGTNRSVNSKQPVIELFMLLSYNLLWAHNNVFIYPFKLKSMSDFLIAS